MRLILRIENVFFEMYNAFKGVDCMDESKIFKGEILLVQILEIKKLRKTKIFDF